MFFKSQDVWKKSFITIKSTHVHNTQIQAMNAVVLCSRLCLLCYNTNLPLALGHRELWKNTFAFANEKIIPLTKSFYANYTLINWFQLMRKPTNGSKCPNSVEAERTVKVLSLSDADSHICTHADPLTEEARLQNYPESLSVVKGTVTLSNTSTKEMRSSPSQLSVMLWFRTANFRHIYYI